MKRGLRAVIGKEFRHLRRDPMGLVYILLVPFIMIWLYGYGINLDVRDVRTAVVDHSGGRYADRLVRMLAGSALFIPERLSPRTGDPRPLETAERLMREGKVRQILVIPEGFDTDLAAGKPAEIGLILDGSETQSAPFIGRTTERLIDEFRAGLGAGQGLAAVRTRVAFNPEGRSSAPLLAGLFAVILMVLSALLTATALARERETGSVDMVLLSPLSSGEYILGKAAPYALVALLDGGLILVLARWWFHLPLLGSPAALGVMSFLFVLTGVATGVLISTLVTTQREATIAEVLITLLPAFFLSGFILPLESLPPVLLGLSRLVPAAYFIKVVRGIALKGAGWREFLFEGAALGLYAAALLALSIWAFSRRRSRPR